MQQLLLMMMMLMTMVMIMPVDGVLGLSAWAPAFKVLIAPLVDSVYSTTLGRRKTWVVGCQYCISLVMFALSLACSSDKVSLATYTFGFGALSVFASAQDIAVDSWGLQLPATYVHVFFKQLFKTILFCFIV